MSQSTVPPSLSHIYVPLHSAFLSFTLLPAAMVMFALRPGFSAPWPRQARRLKHRGPSRRARPEGRRAQPPRAPRPRSALAAAAAAPPGPPGCPVPGTASDLPCPSLPFPGAVRADQRARRCDGAASGERRERRKRRRRRKGEISAVPAGAEARLSAPAGARGPADRARGTGRRSGDAAALPALLKLPVPRPEEGGRQGPSFSLLCGRKGCRCSPLLLLLSQPRSRSRRRPLSLPALFPP